MAVPKLHLVAAKRTQEMNITFVTSSSTDEECRELLRLSGFPFKGLPVVVATMNAIEGKKHGRN